MRDTARRTCTACHQREMRCDAQELGFPCTNCKDASRDDCRVHQKRRRGSSAITTKPSFVPYQYQTVGNRTYHRLGTPNSDSPASVPKVEVSGTARVDLITNDDVEYVYRRQLMEFIDQPQFIDRSIDKDARLTYIYTDVSNISFLISEQY